MDLDTFNALGSAEAAAVLRPCAEVGSWIEGVVGSRPYDSLDSLLVIAEATSAPWGAAEVDEALGQHPRIGERPAGGGVEATLSTAEQSGISGDEDAIADGNRAYEDTFGRIFLIRAAGRTSAEVLDQLTERLDNDPETEIAVAAGQLREIALLRLKGIFTDD
ncbi:MAG: putative urate oxidase, N-terminal [Marmoricola sp.]|nr:putative urate oxidase, N-terminal [Marmoricola sp.]